MSDTAWCTNCQRWLPVKTFPPDQRMRDGLSSHCRRCRADAVKRWRDANADYVAAYNAARRLGPFELTCAECGGLFTAARRDALVCSRRCKHARFRRRVKERAA
jgi:hypothetical protein